MNESPSSISSVQRFSNLVDFHVVAMLVLLVPIALLLAKNQRSAHYSWVWFVCIPVVPQATLLTRVVSLRRSGQSPLPYLVANELVVITCLVVALSQQFGHVQ